MENPIVSELRSRSRSKTPFLRSSCDRESCLEDDHSQNKSGRKTPIKRSTPIKQLGHTSKKSSVEPVIEEEPSHYTRLAARTLTGTLVKTSDYSSEESLDRLKVHKKEIIQNEINSQYERVSSKAHHYSTLADVTLSPIHAAHNVTHDRSTRFGSPTYSACSTDSSFAEQALANASALLDQDPSQDHLPYRLYKMAGEYWNKYPKTDYTYSPLSRDRVELAPGQVAVPNMSRRSLSQFRTQGPVAVDEPDIMTTAWTTSSLRKRFTTADSDDDFPFLRPKDAYTSVDQRWWITRFLASAYTAATTASRNAYRKVVGPSHRYPYTDRRPAKAGVASRAASAAAAPFYWLYTIITTIVTTTVTTITETIAPRHEGESQKYAARYKGGAERRRWPWLLLLALPLLGYGCYTYWDDTAPARRERPVIVDTYKAPVIVPDSDLTKRVAALESWAMNVDTKLKQFDAKLAAVDTLDAQIEHYSLKHMQENLITILTGNDNRDSFAAALKLYFDQHYVTKDQMQALSQEIHERLMNSWKPEMDEDGIRLIIQRYLSQVERRQMELIVEKVKEYVREMGTRPAEGAVDMEAVKRLVGGMLDVYDADKTGLVDYALESAGGHVISTKCTELYQIKTKQYSILGLPVFWVYTSPRYALTPGAMPAECWAFQGFPGYLVVRTYAIIEVTGFSLEHMSRLLAAEGKIESAPKNFSVYGLHGEMDLEPHLFGNYMYDANGTAIQYFPVQHPKTTDIGGVQYPVAYDIVELRVESNHGNPTYTCVYRFRVHGNPLADIRQATEDSIRDSDT